MLPVSASFKFRGNLEPALMRHEGHQAITSKGLEEMKVACQGGTAQIQEISGTARDLHGTLLMKDVI
jgi:hypothetical protein